MNADAPIPAFLRATADGLLLRVKLQPRASANEILGPAGDELRIRVTAPPVDAAANDALLRLLAETLECPRSQIELFRGHNSRHKVIALHRLELTDVLPKLAPAAC